MVRSDLKAGLEAAAKDRELIRQEIKAASEAAAKDRELIRQEIKAASEAAAQDRGLIRKEVSRLADQVDRLNQNYINHLSFHQGLPPKRRNSEVTDLHERENGQNNSYFNKRHSIGPLYNVNRFAVRSPIHFANFRLPVKRYAVYPAHRCFSTFPNPLYNDFSSSSSPVRSP